MANPQENLSDWSKSGEKIQRSAIARTAYIGELYDARTEMFCSRLLFSGSLPAHFFKTQKSSEQEINYCYNDQLSDRFNLLKIEAELQIPILAKCSSFNLSGSGKYLNEEKNSERTVSCSLVYNVSTYYDKFISPFNEIIDHIDETVFNDDQYTHVVVEINWGAKCILTLEQHTSDSRKNTEAEGMLKERLKTLASFIKIKCSGEIDCMDLDKDSFKNLNFKMHSDVWPDGKIPNTIESALELITKIPKYLENVNNGKGKPLSYAMIPIDTFKKLRKYDKTITTILISIDESFIMEMVYFFQEMEILKQKLNDLKNDLIEHKKYVVKDYLPSIQQRQLEIKQAESKIKTILAKYFPRVRSGKIAIEDLMKAAKEHKLPDLERKIKEYIEAFQPIRSKIEFINLCQSKKVNYLGKNEDLDLIMNRNNGHEFFVMYISKKLCDKNERLYKENLNFLLVEAEKGKENSQFIIVDFDISEIKIHYYYLSDGVKIFQYKNSETVSRDAFRESKARTVMNVAQLSHLTYRNYVQNKPKDLIILKLICPGSIKGGCPKDLLAWKCTICQKNLEYDLENNFYCACGKAESDRYEFECSSLRHDKSFLKFDSIRLKDELGKLKLLEEMNILIVGQSGVGKSTWINSIVNYFKYPSLEEAEKGGVVCAIPANFTAPYQSETSLETQNVQVGDKDENEMVSQGQSETQGPKTYSFTLGDRKVRLIDTPGLGNSEGIEKDKENMRKILNRISDMKEIHGICILMKSNDSKIDVLGRFCITELLSTLNKSVARNIIFCFTHSRCSFYSPGSETLITLKRLLKKLQLEDIIELNAETMFCLENEAFRFLCTLKYDNIPQEECERIIYDESWKRSVDETKRFFKHITKLPSHQVTNITTLFKARNLILNLTKPIAEITQIIQSKRAAISDQETRIRNSSGSSLAQEQKIRLEEMIRKYEEEQKIIMETSLQFGAFIEEKAIIPFNDCLIDYMRFLIDSEENNVSTTCDTFVLNNLKDTIVRYEEEASILKMSMKNTNARSNLKPKDIVELEQKLYNLELTGKQIRKYVEKSEASITKAYAYSEQPLPIKNQLSL